MFLFFLLIILIISVGLIIFVGKSSIDNKWKINVFRVNCPKCGEKMPIVRNPTSAHQAMWGGWTCSNCGCEMDKWGKEINIGEAEIAKKQIEETQVNFVKSFDEKGKTPVEKVFEENSK